VVRLIRGLFVVASAAVIALGLTACSSSKSSPGASVSVFHLKPGDCMVPPTKITAQLTSVKVVACREAHTQEVYALIQDSQPSGANYPGDDVLRTFADGQCLQQFSGYTGVDYRRSSLFYTYLLPSVRSWAADDRCVACVITTTGQPLKASVKAPGAKVVSQCDVSRAASSA
jgi:Septum formation